MGTDTTTSWCPTCGAEYRAGISECAECSVGLVPGRPESLPCPEPPDEIRYDLGTWTDDQRTALRWLLESEHIDAVWDGTDVIVIDANEARVDDLVTWMEAQPTVSEEFGQVASAIRPNATSPPRSGSRPFGESGAIAGPGRRLFGFAVDWLVTGAIMSAVVIPTAIHESGGRGAHLTTQVWIAWNIVLLAYYVVPVAIWGRTPGKIAAGTRVVRTSDLTLPGWGSAFVRGLAPLLPAIGTAMLGSPAGTRIAVPIAAALIYGTLLFDPLHRGLHDRAAGTLVVIA